MADQHEILSQEEQQKILEKYDPESATRHLKGILGTIVFLVLLAFSIFQLYASITQSLPRQINFIICASGFRSVPYLYFISS